MDWVERGAPAVATVADQHADAFPLGQGPAFDVRDEVLDLDLLSVDLDEAHIRAWIPILRQQLSGG
ncbi:hypothetical protein GCM10011324_36220 [Allosediminivita pacifica]|nr:hypothetical protein GCM10011324_36220 [Allosediminivita pacifica]